MPDCVLCCVLAAKQAKDQLAPIILPELLLTLLFTSQILIFWRCTIGTDPIKVELSGGRLLLRGGLLLINSFLYLKRRLQCKYMKRAWPGQFEVSI